MALTPRSDDLFLVVDLQYDFLPGGKLAVAGGDEIIIPINRLGRRFENVGMTQDWHPRGHISFASSHAGAKPFEIMELPYGPQVLWPDHCVWDTHGAEFSAEIELPHTQLVIRKGYHEVVDSYSGFQEADRKTKTGLEGYLRERKFKRLFIAGLATDFCVNWTAVDSARAGFETYVIEDACRAIDTSGSLAQAWADMNAVGVKRIVAGDIG
ncbi:MULTISPECIES: bifunctional nicotinamidase/pyrazinamidase [unclassified Devosia]|jgi:nicotinamidase/pyrazinamidase|uniref:bifunctional nicotinamidase/pyrazinamidase n=1 Tax=unclassified Devosia TaxID=196773 RepID=UPI00086AAB7E|nr:MULTISPECIES: bifunctional nicotinamidase/pyrazinamidase [unclassified Devosia]MBN9362316.1 bifunctional nicotinamidase/pyrazinamidase [Devosia sp.]ODS80349.1 MAG: nicotinamidase [Devosia sp. SCN 66-27]OJX24442.1 MAG: nicotinamidase [Devosia sp. 66-14]